MIKEMFFLFIIFKVFFGAIRYIEIYACLHKGEVQWSSRVILKRA